MSQKLTQLLEEMTLQERAEEDAFDGHYDAVTLGCHGLEKRVRSRFQVAVPEDCTVTVQNTDVHAPGMSVDPAVKWVLVGVEAPEVSCSVVSGGSPCQHTTGVGGGAGLNRYQALASDGQ